VVLGGGQGERPLPVHEGQEARLLALQELLHHAARARLAEGAPLHDLADGGLGGGGIRAEEDPLARGQAVRLDRKGAPPRAHESLGLLRVAEDPEGRRGDARLPHELLGEGLARLDPGGGFLRAEDAESLRLQPVGQAERQGGLGAHHHEAGPLAPGEGEETPDVLGRDGFVSAHLGRARVAGGAEDLGDLRALLELPGQGVLPPARAHDEEFHGGGSPGGRTRKTGES